MVVIVLGVIVLLVAALVLAAVLAARSSAVAARSEAAPDLTAAVDGAARSPRAAGSGAAYGPDERRLLLELARSSLTLAVTEGRTLELPASVPASLREPRGVFVTLEIAGELRGCIGHIFPTEPLALAVIHNASSAALRDTRFSPVVPAELDRIAIEVSVLSVPEPLAYDGPDDLLQKLRPGIDGVVLEIRGRRSTFLPQVWEELADPVEFLDHLSRKGGSATDAWRGRGVTVLTYRAEAFAEPGSGHE